MKSDIQIIPAILATSEKEYKEKLQKIEESGEFNGGWVQIDLMDNKFVQNKSIDPEIISKYPVNFKLEAHLMVDYPESWIDELIKAGVKRIIFPLEDEAGVIERITHIKNHGIIEVGLALNPQTPVAKVEPFVDKIDTVLLLAVLPGFGGQEFLPQTIEKIRELVKLKQENRFLIEVDGGISEQVTKQVEDAGADIAVIGAHLIDGDITKNLEKLWQSLRG